MSYYPESGSHFNSKVKVILGLRNQATKKELEDAAGVDTSKLTAKKDFITLKAEVEKIDIHKLVNAPIGLNNLKTKLDNFDVDKLKFVPIDLKKISDRVSKKVAKNTKYNELILVVNNLENKFLIHLL